MACVEGRTSPRRVRWGILAPRGGRLPSDQPSHLECLRIAKELAELKGNEQAIQDQGLWFDGGRQPAGCSLDGCGCHRRHFLSVFPRHMAAKDTAGLLEVSRSGPSVERHWVVRGLSLTELDAALSAGLPCTRAVAWGVCPKAAEVVRDYGRQPVQVHSMVDDVFPTVWPGIDRVLLDTPGKTGGDGKVI